MTITIIAAHDVNGIIGLNNKLPWHLPEDLKHFKQFTSNKPMIMGRRTFESLPGILPGRPHIVITSSRITPHPNVFSVNTIDDAITLSYSFCPDVCVIGGSMVYQQFLSISDFMILTQINQSFNGDTWFPIVQWDEWEQAYVMHVNTSSHPCDFKIYRRKQK